MPSPPWLTISLLGVLTAFGFDALHGQLQRNGYTALVDELLQDSNKPRFLPGTNRLLLRRYVGHPVVDHVLSMLNVFFADVVDGRSPALSMFAVQFGGQLIPGVMMLMAESQRVGSKVALRSFMIWGMAIQLLGFGVVMPFYCLLHLVLDSRPPSAAQTIRLRDRVQLQVIVPAVVLGFLVPTLLAVYPFESSDVRQRCVALWQAFPIYVGVFQLVIAAAVKRTSVSSGSQDFASPEKQDWDLLRSVYRYGLTYAVTTQIMVGAGLLVAAVRPDLLLPNLAAGFTFSNVFVPKNPHSFDKMTSPAAAMHGFLQYDQYVAAAALLLWAATLLRRAGGVLDGSLLFATLKDCVVYGPVGAAMCLLRRRDEMLVAAQGKGSAVKRR